MNGLFHLENEPEGQVRYMTTPQLAEIAGVSRQTTWRAARKLFPERMREGVAFMLNQDEALYLLDYIKPGAFNIGNIETVSSATNVANLKPVKPETRGKKSQKQLMEEVAEIAINAYKQGLKDGAVK